MDQGVVIRCLILLLLVQQINSGDWFQFDKDHNDDFYDINIDFKLDEVDDHSYSYGSSYNNFGDVDGKMEMHDFFANVCLWGALFIVGAAVIGTQGKNAKRACTLILFLSLVNNDSGGTSTRCKRLSNLFTESIYGTFNFKPGVTYEDRNSPNLVTIATSVSFIWKRAWNKVNKEIITKTINGVNFLFI